MMDWMEESEENQNQKYWSGWSLRRPKRRLVINNYLSAVVFVMSAFAVMANYSA